MLKFLIGVVIGAIFDDWVIAFLLWAVENLRVMAAG